MMIVAAPKGSRRRITSVLVVRVGTPVGNVKEASNVSQEVAEGEADRLQFQILSADGLRITSIFNINSRTGAIFTNAMIDREQVRQGKLLCLSLSFRLSLSLARAIFLSICLSVFICLCLYLSLSFCPCLSVYLSV